MRSTTGSANTPNPDLSPAPRLDEATRPRGPRARRGTARPRRRRGRREGGPAGFGGGLASARDRRRVLERNAAERDRVERALAAAPPFDLDGGVAAPPPRRRRPAPARPVSPSARTAPAGAGHCPVCASTKLASDEVFATGHVMRLVECLNCDHRFTARPRARWRDLGARMTRSNVAETA